jgi:hypothetical protein
MALAQHRAVARLLFRASGGWITERLRLASSHDRLFWKAVTIREHECIALKTDLSGEGLQAGDVGTVDHVRELSVT